MAQKGAKNVAFLGIRKDTILSLDRSFKNLEEDDPHVQCENVKINLTTSHSHKNIPGFYIIKDTGSHDIPKTFKFTSSTSKSEILIKV